MTRLGTSAAALLAFAAALVAAPRAARAGGNTAFRNPANPSQVIQRLWDARQLPIPWAMSSDGLPGSGLTNGALAAELQAAFDTWEALPTSKLDFQYEGEIALRESGLGGILGPGIDGRNLVTFTDPAVTFPTGVLAVAITFSFTTETTITNANNDLDEDGTPDLPNGVYPAGTIFDGDIVFNSSEPWSTAGDNGSIDVRAVALHEVGHFFGLSHSGIRDAVMFPFLAADIAAVRTPKADDVAYASLFYPQQPAFSSTFGAIRGRVRNGFTNGPVLGAHVFSVDPLTGAQGVGAFTGDDGSYVLPGLAPGNHLVAIEPLDGDPPGLDPFRINEVIQFTFDTNFPEEFYDADEAGVEADPAAGLAVAVAAGVDTPDVDLVTNALQVPGVSRILEPGYNLFAYPVAAPSDLHAFELLQSLGDANDVNAIDRFAPQTGLFERAEYQDGAPAGVDFPIRRGEGYVVHAAHQKVVSFAGGTDCPDLDLARGMNLVGIPCPPAGYTAYALLEHLGSELEVQSIQRFDPETAGYEEARYDGVGAPTGDDFPIVNGEGYVVTMLADKAGLKIPPPGTPFAPVITGLSPGRGVPGTVVLILGEGFDPDPSRNSVSFNGIGAGVVFATATSLTATVPGAASTGPVRVSVAGRQSNAVEFVVDPVATPEVPGEPTPLTSGQTADGVLGADGEQDRYEFTALAGTLVTVQAESVTPGVPDLVLVLEDPFGVAVASDDNGGGDTNPRLNNFVVEQTGTHTIVVTSVPGSGTGAYRVSLTLATRSAPPQVSILGGDFQSGVAGSELPVPLSVLVTGPSGAPVAGAPVTFVATDAEFTTSGVTPTNAGTVVLTTNASGIVVVKTVLAAAPNLYKITVTAPGFAPVMFTVAATTVPVHTVTMSGDAQTGTVGQALPTPLQITLRDGAGNPVNNALVGFLVAAGGGSLAPSGGQQTAAGAASTTFTLGKKIKDAHIVAAFVPNSPRPLLFTATAQAGPPAKVKSNKSNFNRLTLGTAVLNGLQVEVSDQFDNPVAGATITYTAPADLEIAPGLGEDGIFYSDFKTRADGRHVAQVIALESATPTIDEFGTVFDPNLADTYAVSASVGGLGASQDYTVDVDMGPTMVTASGQVDGALIGQPLTQPVRKRVLRWERVDGPDVDKDWRNEDFSSVVERSVPGVTVKFKARRQDGKTETAPLLPTTPGAPSAVTGADGIASVAVTMGHVGGVNNLIGTADTIPVDFKFADGTFMLHQNFTNGKKFAESTVLRAIPVVITVTLGDAFAGIAFNTVRAALNGTTFFDGSAAQATAKVFPEKLELVVGGVPRGTWDANTVNNSAFQAMQVRYEPAFNKLQMGANSVQVERVRDKVRNEQAAVTTQGFTFP